MRPLSVALLACLALAATACGERAEPVGRSVPLFPVTVRDAQGDDLTLREAPERIAALDPGAAELVAALGAGERLVGVPSGLSLPEAPEARAITHPNGLLDAAALETARPDLLLAAPGGESPDLREAATDAPVYVQADSTVRDVVETTLDLGFLVGEPVAARRLAARIRSETATAEARARDLPPVRVFVDTGFLITVPDDSLTADLVRRAGGMLVGLGASASPGDACDLLRLRPQVVLRVVEDDAAVETPAPRFGGCPPRTEPLPRIADVPADLVERAGPRAGEALDRVVATIHADGRR